MKTLSQINTEWEKKLKKYKKCIEKKDYFEIRKSKQAQTLLKELAVLAGMRAALYPNWFKGSYIPKR